MQFAHWLGPLTKWRQNYRRLLRWNFANWPVLMILSRFLSRFWLDKDLAPNRRQARILPNCDNSQKTVVSHSIFVVLIINQKNEMRLRYVSMKTTFQYINSYPVTPHIYGARLCHHWFGSQNSRFFVLCDLENKRAHFLCYFKLCASFHSYLWIQNWVTVRKRSRKSVKIGDFCPVWTWNLTDDLQK